MKKQLINTFRRIVLCSTILWATWACQEIAEAPIQDSPLEIEKDFDLNSDPELKIFLEKNNFTYETIKKSGDSYLIDGDIILSRESILSSPLPKMQKGGISPENLHAYNSLITSSPYNYKTITIGFDSTIPTTSDYLNYRTATEEAIEEYNQIRNLRLKFEIITTGTPDITITSQQHPDFTWDEAPYTIAVAHFPSAGNPGIKVHINPTYEDLEEMTDLTKKYTMAHELGHTIGFRHTNYLTSDHSSTHSTASNVKGTGNSDPNSVMNGGAVHPWTAFSYLDLLAMRTLYPYDAGEVPLYSYIKPATGGFNWTINWSTYQYGGSGYSYYGLNGYVFTYPLSGTVPLYKYKHSTTHVDYMSLNPNLTASIPGYVSEGLIGYVFTSSASNRIPIYEWYHPNKGFHFTTLTNDGVVQSGGWSGGGIAFYTVNMEWW